MNRREFFARLATLGLTLPATKTIFDLGANARRYPEVFGDDRDAMFDCVWVPGVWKATIELNYEAVTYLARAGLKQAGVVG